MKALREARARQSSQTGFVHREDVIPTYENLCFALSLFRTHIGEQVEEGKDILKRLFGFFELIEIQMDQAGRKLGTGLDLLALRRVAQLLQCTDPLGRGRRFFIEIGKHLHRVGEFGRVAVSVRQFLKPLEGLLGLYIKRPDEGADGDLRRFGLTGDRPNEFVHSRENLRPLVFGKLGGVGRGLDGVEEFLRRDLDLQFQRRKLAERIGRHRWAARRHRENQHRKQPHGRLVPFCKAVVHKSILPSPPVRWENRPERAFGSLKSETTFYN